MAYFTFYDMTLKLTFFQEALNRGLSVLFHEGLFFASLEGYYLLPPT